MNSCVAMSSVINDLERLRIVFLIIIYNLIVTRDVIVDNPADGDCDEKDCKQNCDYVTTRNTGLNFHESMFYYFISRSMLTSSFHINN